MRELMQRKKLRLMAAVLSLFMILGLVSHISGSASGDTPKDPNDITEYVNIKLQNFSFTKNSKTVYFYQNGQPVEATYNEHVLYPRDNFDIDYSWDISPENMSHVATGKYFKVKLPAKTALEFKGYKDIPVTSGGKTIGKFDVYSSEEYAKITLSGDFKGMQSIKNGNLKFSASLTSNNFEEIVFVPNETQASSRVTIRIKTKVNQGITDEPGKDSYNLLNPKNILQKEGRQMSGDKADWIEYTLRVNYRDIADTYKSGVKVDKKNNVYIVDEMSEDLVVNPSSAHVSVYTRAAQVDKNTKAVTEEISSNVLYYTSIYSGTSGTGDTKQIKYGKSDKVFFDIVKMTEEDEPNFNKFKEKILGMPKRTIGFWNGTKIVVKIGTLPLDDLHYEDGFAKTHTEALNVLNTKLNGYLDLSNHPVLSPAAQLNQTQVDYFKRAYIGKPIVNFTLRYQAKPKGAPSPKPYNNRATMYWDHGQMENKSIDVRVTRASASAEMEPFKGEYTVTKKWLGAEQDSVRVQLYKDGQAYEAPVTLDRANNWTHKYTFTGLDPKDVNANTFTVEEVNPPAGYRSVVVPVEGQYASVIENYEQVTLKLRKKWLKDGAPLTDTGVEKVIFYLHDKSETNPDSTNYVHRVEISKTDVGSEEGVWEKEITVDKTDKSGKVYDFKVTEAKVAGFTQKGDAECDIARGFTITNEKEAPVIQKINLNLTKKWLDHTKADLANPAVEEVTLYLHNKKEATPTESNALQTVVLKKTESWTKTVELNKKDSQGVDIEYVVSEKPVPGFKKGVVTGNAASGFIITNEKEAPVIEKIDLTLTKKWLDHTKADLANPAVEEVTLYLHDKKETAPTESNALQTVVLKKTESWTKTVEVNKQNDNGEVIEYVVSEKPVPGFKKGVVTGNAASGFIITNEKEAPVIKKIDLTLTKKWLDKGAVLADPGLEKVTFYLHDAKETNRTELNALYVEDITKADSWTKTVSVNKKDDKGADIVYVVSEKAVDGFNQKGVTVGNHTEGFTITNEKIPPVAPYYPYYPIYIPVPEVPSVVPNTPAGETPTPPTPPAPNVPNDPVNEVPETPEVPEVVTVEDEDEEDIEVIGDNTPRGDTDIEEDEPKTKKKKKDSDKDVNLDDDSTPRGRKNILAKTGGLKTTFIPFAAMLAILALAFAAVQVFVRKKR